jgi:hypothetical protein
MEDVDIANWQPPWVKTLLGKHPALTREVTEDEIIAAKTAQQNALAMVESPLAIHLSPEEQFLVSARSRVESFKVNLAAFFAEKPSAENSVRIKSMREGLAKAYRDLGEWQKALETICDKNWHALASFAELRNEIIAWHQAVERPDDERCACPPPVLEVVSPHTGNIEKRSVPEAQFSIAGMCFSHLHNKVVRVNRCSVCGDLNAIDGVYQELIQIEQIRNANHKPETLREKFSDFQLTK